MKRLDALRDLVAKHIDESQSRTEKCYTRGRKTVVFNEGNFVMRKIKTLSKAFEERSGKLSAKYDGPFRIARALPSVTHWLKGVRAKQCDIILDEPRVPVDQT